LLLLWLLLLPLLLLWLLLLPLLVTVVRLGLLVHHPASLRQALVCAATLR
jgi:hypothetical protein